MKTKNAIISTIHLDYLLSNYGSFWQHWCLRRYLKDKGWRVSRYAALDCEFKYWKWVKTRLLDYLRIFIYWPIKQLKNRRYISKNLRSEYRRTSLFIREYRQFIGALKEDAVAGRDALFIMGSDQNLNLFHDNWFAGFPDGNKRVMYAGSTDWVGQRDNERWLAIAKRELPRFSAISVREKVGIDVCSKFTELPIVHVVDPVMLVDPELLKDQACRKVIFTRPTLLCYLVNVHSEDELQLEKLKGVARNLECDLKIIGLQGTAGYVPREYELIPSPTEFLGAMRDAKYVITNSFHGTAFSIVFRKPYICLCQVSESGCDSNTRQRELLEWVGMIKNYMPTNVSASDVVSALQMTSFCQNFTDAVSRQRNISRKWLDLALLDCHLRR